MKVKLIFHGHLKKYNHDFPEKEIDIDESTTIAQLIKQTMVPDKEIAFTAVNGSRVSRSHIIKENDTIKLYQWVGGG